jgi:hypothetical protein
MPHSCPLRIAPFLFGCLLAIAIQSRAEDQPTRSKTVVQIELWMAELNVAKLRTLDLTCEYLDADGQSRKTKVIDVLEGKANDAPILQHPDKLLAVLRGAGVARVFCEPTLATLSGRKASLAVGGSKFDATPSVLESGQIRLDVHAEHNEPTPRIGRRNPPGNQQWVVETSVNLESGKTVLPMSLDQVHMTYPNGKPAPSVPIPFVLIRATVVKPGDSVGPVRTAGAVDRELR